MIIIKQSAASAFSIFGGMILGIVVGIVVLLFGFIGLSVLAAAIATALVLLAAAGLYRSIIKVKSF